MSEKRAPEPTLCGCKSCGSKIFTEKKTEIVDLPSRKTVVTTWSCLKGHIQQTEMTLLPDDWVNIYGGIPFIPWKKAIDGEMGDI